MQADVLDLPALDDAMQNIEEVYHAVAMVSFEKKSHQQMMKVNVEGTENVMNLAAKHQVKKVLHVSSVAALGRNEGDKTITENATWQDSGFNTQYAISKMLAERIAFRAAAENLNVAFINPCVMLGAGHWDEGSAAFFSNIYKGLPFYTNGVNAFVGVEDAANIAIQLLQKNIFNQRFIVAENNYGYKQIFDWIAQSLEVKAPSIAVGKTLSEIAWRTEVLKTLLTGKKSIITRETATTAHLKCYYSNDKIKKELNYNFTPIEKVIVETAKIFLESKKN